MFRPFSHAFSRQPIEHTVVVKVFLYGQAPEEVGISAYDVHSLPDLMSVREAIHAQNMNIATIRKKQGAENRQKSGLPRAVGTQDTEDLPFFDLKV